MNVTCAETSCTRPVKARGPCETHYERQRTEGRPCSHPGCGRPIRARGLCKTQYDRARNAGRVWAVRGCAKPVKSAGLCFTHHLSRVTEGRVAPSTDACVASAPRGLCKRHYEEALAAGSVCVITGCRRSPLGGGGMCYMHRRRYLSDGDADDAVPRRAPNSAGSINADGYRTFYVPERGRRIVEKRRTILPEVTNLSVLWRLLSCHRSAARP